MKPETFRKHLLQKDNPELYRKKSIAILGIEETNKLLGNVKSYNNIQPTQTYPLDGPGTEAKKILVILGVSSNQNCSCESFLIQMNIWGVEGCKNNFDTIYKHFKDNKDFVKVVTVAVNAVRTGLIKEIGVIDPIKGIINLAVKRSEIHSS